MVIPALVAGTHSSARSALDGVATFDHKPLRSLVDGSRGQAPRRQILVESQFKLRHDDPFLGTRKAPPNRRRILMSRLFTAIIEREGDAYVAFCPEVDIASEGETVSDARANLAEAIELFLETASDEEKARRLSCEIYVTQIEVRLPADNLRRT
jgi:predicted RNase H-like HicB family nuclease